MRFGCPSLRRRRSGYVVVPCPLPSPNLRSIAYHEAGHAVLYAALRFRIDSCVATNTDGLTISHYPVAEGAQLEKISQKKFLPQAEQDAACWLSAGAFAGIQAEMLMHGLPFRGMFKLQDVDTRNADRYLMNAFPLDGDRDAAAGYAQELARAAMMHLWLAVEAAAEILVAHGEIDNDGVVAALSMVEDIEEIGRMFATEEVFHSLQKAEDEALPKAIRARPLKRAVTVDEVCGAVQCDG